MDPVKLEDPVKERVFSAFPQEKGSLTNGVSSLKGVPGLSWTCNEPTHTETILIWHIATWYCEMQEGSQVEETNDYKVATALSRYCAYLVAFLPEFLPEHSFTTTNVFQRVLGEAEKLLDTIELERNVELGELPREKPVKFTRIEALKQPTEEANLNTVQKGVKLARDLLNEAEVKSSEQRWKVMADFWAETMVYIAPSEKVAAHIDQLAKGGEFITHIWALLSNAGIHERTNGGCESTAPPDNRYHQQSGKDAPPSTSGEH
jgi:hypothetical protein